MFKLTKYNKAYEIQKKFLWFYIDWVTQQSYVNDHIFTNFAVFENVPRYLENGRYEFTFFNLVEALGIDLTIGVPDDIFVKDADDFKMKFADEFI